MRNRNALIINGNEVTVTKDFERKARIFGTEEYKKWRELLADIPEAKMVTKTIKRKSDKKTYKNLTYNNIKRFLEVQENSEELLKEYQLEKNKSIIQSSPYHYIQSWFINKFRDYDKYVEIFSDKANVEEDKKETSDIITNNNVTNIKKASNE